MTELLTNKQMSKSSFAAPQVNKPMPVILIADDDEDSRLMLKTLLEMWNYQVLEAKGGIEAVSIAETKNPDLILMDVKMPIFDGFDAARQIRQSAKIGDVPIIFLSGCAEADYRSKGFAARGNEYLVKPLDFEELENTLGKYLCGSPRSSAANLYSPTNF